MLSVFMKFREENNSKKYFAEFSINTLLIFFREMYVYLYIYTWYPPTYSASWLYIYIYNIYILCGSCIYIIYIYTLLNAVRWMKDDYCQ